MKLSLSWIAEQASKAGADYLDKCRLSEAEKMQISNDPNRLIPGSEGWPDWHDVNPAYWEYRKHVMAGKDASQVAATIKAALAINGGPDANRMQGLKNMGIGNTSDKPDYVSEKRRLPNMARAVIKTNA